MEFVVRHELAIGLFGVLLVIFVVSAAIWWARHQEKESETRLKLAASVFDACREGIIITDANHRVLDVNRAFTELLGYTLDEIQHRHVSLIFFPTESQTLLPEMVQALDHGSGEWNGEVRYRSREGKSLPAEASISTVRDGSQETQHHVAVFRDIRARLRYEAELRWIASYDPLTGLANRRLLADQLEKAMARAEERHASFRVCMLDLDGFKPINDQHGHEAGDKVLIQVAERLQAHLHRSETAARLGGDEFVLVLGGNRSDDAIEDILAVVEEPIRLDSPPVIVQVSASLGMAAFDPHAPVDGDLLLRRADQAAYRAKEQGGGRWARFMG
ncbi:diguanylate cyclase domain-containing protein [Spiribacter insolitus]|uniref:Diguanylate cyclase n=1 Tax=Spiribacter insolitus TaxID=3122417 RepID=A0ABV3T8R0_9GAMM